MTADLRSQLPLTLGADATRRRLDLNPALLAQRAATLHR
jgi:hypothetical protein